MQRREKCTGTVIKTETGYQGKIDIGCGAVGKRKFKYSLVKPKWWNYIPLYEIGENGYFRLSKGPSRRAGK